MPENHKIDVGHVQANFKNLVLPMGLRVDTVSMEAEGLHFETEPFLASVREPGSFEVFVSEASLSEFVNSKAPSNVRKFRIRSLDGKLDVQASVVMLIELPASAICTLKIVDNRYLYVELESVNVMGAGATTLVQGQLEKLNPILDVEEFPVRASLNHVEIIQGGVRLTGTVAPP